MPIKNEDGLGVLINDAPYCANGNIGNRATPCRWSSHEKKRFIELIKQMGKQFAEIAKIIKTKNEQQCRTKGLILYNKLKINNFDPKLFEILAPSRPGQPKNGDSVYKRRRYVPKSERRAKE